MNSVNEDSTLRDLALARGWISAEQAASSLSLSELLSKEKFRLLKGEQETPTQPVHRKMMNQLVQGGLLKGADILDSVREKFGRYEILRRIGEGGTGQVYLARDPQMEREVAVKILDRDGMSTIDRFHQEMEILGAMTHPGIVTIYDAGVEEGQPYYTMEYIGSKSLQGLRPSVRASADIVAAVAEACHAAHEKGIIHRDLKPANILMGDRPVVADFGIAKRQNAELTETGVVLGTPYYMSPEQALGKPVGVTTDVYSLGVILYELVTGLRPFDGPNIAEITRKIVEVEPVAPRNRNREVPGDLEVIILKAMAKEPGRRYPSARDFVVDLRAWKEGRPILARRTSLPGRLFLAAKRKPRTALGYAGTFCLAGVALILGLTLGGNSGEDPEQTRLREEAERTIANERVAIEAWRPNLYLPPRRISYKPLEVSVGIIDSALEREDLSPQVRSQGLQATAKAHVFMGNMQDAMKDLEGSIRFMDSGDARLERVFICWESVCRDRFVDGFVPETRFQPMLEDLRKANSLGCTSRWRSELAKILLKVTGRPGKESAQEAIHSLEELAGNSNGPSEEVQKLIGDMYFFLGKPDLAIPFYRKAIEDRRSYVQAYNALGIALYLGKDDGNGIREGVKAALHAIEINPNYIDSYLLFSRLCQGGLQWYYLKRLLQSEVLQDIDLLENARKRFQEAPAMEAILIARGTASLLIGVFKMGVDEDPAPILKEAVEAFLKVNGFDGWFGLGRTYVMIARSRKESSGENLSRASRFLKKAEEMKPSDPEVLSWIGFCRYLERDYEGAVEKWNGAVKVDSTYAAKLTKWFQKAREKK